MKHNAYNSARRLMPLLLIAAVSACSSVPRPMPAPPPQLWRPQPLSPQAQQPPLPAWCLPTCSAGLTQERLKQLERLTPPTPPAPPASASMTPR